MFFFSQWLHVYVTRKIFELQQKKIREQKKKNVHFFIYMKIRVASVVQRWNLCTDRQFGGMMTDFQYFFFSIYVFLEAWSHSHVVKQICLEHDSIIFTIFISNKKSYR